MKKFVLEIEMGNDAMQTDADLADALSGVIDRLDRGTLCGVIQDVNGNVVGRFAIHQEGAE